jgi:Fe-S cluster assembly protein SufD
MTTFSREAVEALSASFNEPDWMLQFRLRAWEVYERTPLPTLQDEAWRRTDIRRLKWDQLGPSLSLNGRDNGRQNGDLPMPSYLGAQLTEDVAGGVLVEVNGVVTQYELSDELKAQGVIFCDMHTAVREHGDLVRQYFMTQAVRVDEGKFAALHGAFWHGGVFLYVPRNVVAAAPFTARCGPRTAEPSPTRWSFWTKEQTPSFSMNTPHLIATGRRCIMA